jgi:hypothetical protein
VRTQRTAVTQDYVMEPLFRFAVTRPATTASPDAAVAVDRRSPLQVNLTAARLGSSARATMKQLATTYRSSPSYAPTMQALSLGTPFARFRSYLRDHGGDGAEDARGTISRLFGKSVTQLVNDATFQQDDLRAADSLVTAKILPEAHRDALTELADVVRMTAAIRELAATPRTQWRAALVLAPVLSLPSGIFPLPPDVAAIPTDPDDDTQELRDRIAHLTTAIDELLAFDIGEMLEDASLPPVDVTASIAAAATDDGSSLPPDAVRRADAFALSSDAAETLTTETRALLSQRRFDATATPLDRIVNAFARDLDATGRQLTRREQQPLSALYSDRRTAAGGRASLAAIPASFGTLRSVGIADLLVVKQDLLRYEAHEVAHIENILKGESKKREHKRAVSTEQITITETERVSEEERELESTDRFEMSREASEVIRLDASVSAGLTVSGSYGPTVEFEATVQGAMQSARERATSHATNYSRDVTERTTSRVSERVREERSLKIVTSVEERNEHVIDNSRGTGHVRGIYQWVNKVYQAQVYNYGRRALFDFTVPEPAAFVIHALRAKHGSLTGAAKEPKPFAITPLSINEANYAGYVRDWEATGVAPPPEPYVMVSKVFRGGPDSPDSPTRGGYIDGAEIVVPDGYQAVYATVSRHFNTWQADAYVDVAVGGQTRRMRNNGGWTWNTQLGQEVGTLPICVKTFRTSLYTVGVEIKCQRTARAMDKWRHDTFAALLEAYQRQRAAYEEQLAAVSAQVGVAIAGTNPYSNRSTEMRELKKSCLSVLTAQQFDVFGAIDFGADGIPQLDLGEVAVEGPYIRFFEQAFEWNNMTYVFYPYFWGRRAAWVERFNYEDVDPLFADFLRAGAARVVLPVRPGFELALDHFLQTGEVWEGGELPPVTSDMYVPIVQELRENLGAPGDELPQGQPWEVTVPTSLIRLKTDGELPSWDSEAARVATTDPIEIPVLS